MSKIVAIVGRPNVGKSTFFNRLTESRDAIVDEVSGVTRDRLYGKSYWNGVEFSVIDTGGYVVNSDDVFEEEIRKQVHLAIDEADLILFLVDVTSGITGLDETVADLLRKKTKKVILVVNKVDNSQRLMEANEFYALGFDDMFSLSAINGSGTGELLDMVVGRLPEDKQEVMEDIPKIAVVGRPNVGKSTIINTFLGQERNIVTPIAGTTRDSIYTRFKKFNYDFYLIDTAGLRKKGKVHEDLEFYSVLRSVRAIEKSDICLLMIDGTQGVESQDMNIFNLAIKNRKGLIILVNKWDLVKKGDNTLKEYTEAIKKRIAPFNDVPILFISALNKQRVHKVLEMAMQVYENRIRKIKTSLLNSVMLEAINLKPPPSVKGKYIRIKFVTQLPTHAPSFAFYCNLPQYIKEPYKRYLENRLRERFSFTGVPIQIFMRKK